MKRIKYLMIIILALTLCGAVFFACGSSLPEDHSSLLKAGKIYRVTYNSSGGSFAGGRCVYMYYDTDDIKTADPKDPKGTFVPTRHEQFVTGWYYKEITTHDDGSVSFEKKPWNFSVDKIKKENMTEQKDQKTKIIYYDFELFAEWEYYLYIDYSISYVDLDGETYLGTLAGSTYSKEADVSDHNIVTSETKTQSNLISYTGISSIKHSSGTAVPEKYDEIKHENIRRAQDIRPFFYSEPDMKEESRVLFPLDSDIAPKPIKDKNHVRIYVKFFAENFTVIATPEDIDSFSNVNYYLWRDIDFATTDTDGTIRKKQIEAGNLFENKVFFGNGYKMSNLLISSTQASSPNDMGIFSKIINSEITDLTLENCTVYYYMNTKVNNINCGILAGTISGSNTKLENVNLINVQGYIRNNKASNVFDVKFSEENDYLYNSSDNSTINISGVDAGAAQIKYMNVFIEVTDEESSACGFTRWFNDDVANQMLEISLGSPNETLTQRTAVTDFYGNSTQYYIALDITLTEIDDIELSVFGADYILATDARFGFVKKDDVYYCRIYVPENVKGGKIIVKWNNEVSDTYKYIVDGGSATLVSVARASELFDPNIDVSYDKSSHTLSYSGTLNYYQPSSAQDKRPEGYAVPVTLRMYAKILETDVVMLTINGQTFSFQDLNFVLNASGGFLYCEFWVSVEKNATTASQITIDFYNSRYSVILNVAPDTTRTIKYGNPPAQSAFVAPTFAAPVQIIVKENTSPCNCAIVLLENKGKFVA